MVSNGMKMNINGLDRLVAQKFKRVISPVTVTGDRGLTVVSKSYQAMPSFLIKVYHMNFYIILAATHCKLPQNM